MPSKEIYYQGKLPSPIAELLALHSNLELMENVLLTLSAKQGKSEQRYKRDLTSHFALANANDSLSRNSSGKDAIAQIIQEIQSTLEILELKFIDGDGMITGMGKSNNTTKLTSSGFVRTGKFPKVGGRVGTKCQIEAETVKVNCSDVIYDEEKTWHKSRLQIDLLIKILKEKISRLKTIKKQLRETKQQQLQQQHQHPTYYNKNHHFGNFPPRHHSNNGRTK